MVLADMPMSMRKCSAPRSDSEVTSSTPTSASRSSKIGAAQQDSPVRLGKKCSPRLTTSGRRSASAVPMPLVPQARSLQSLPGHMPMRAAWRTKMPSPRVSSTVPPASAITTRVSRSGSWR